ncbi:MAG: hypothetical protein RhofKO_30790 [Rhodothermales bacterium]
MLGKTRDIKWYNVDGEAHVTSLNRIALALVGPPAGPLPCSTLTIRPTSMLEALIIALVIYFGAPAVRNLIDAVKNDPLAPPQRSRMQAPPRPSPYTTTVRQRQTAPASAPRYPYEVEDARFRDIR